ALAEDLDQQTLTAWLGTGAAQVAQLVPGLAEPAGPTTPPAVSSPGAARARSPLPPACGSAGVWEAVAIGVAEEPGTGGYRFSHALIGEVLYERLPIPARMQLHQRGGEGGERGARHRPAG